MVGAIMMSLFSSMREMRKSGTRVSVPSGRCLPWHSMLPTPMSTMSLRLNYCSAWGQVVCASRMIASSPPIWLRPRSDRGGPRLRAPVPSRPGTPEAGAPDRVDRLVEDAARDRLRPRVRGREAEDEGGRRRVKSGRDGHHEPMIGSIPRRLEWEVVLPTGGRAAGTSHTLCGVSASAKVRFSEGPRRPGTRGEFSPSSPVRSRTRF